MNRLYTLILFLFCSIVLSAQTIHVSAPQNVSAGEQFRLQYKVMTQDVEDFRAGEVPEGLEVLMGPRTSVQSSFQMTNGHTSSSSSITYTYILYAEEAGTYTIPAANAIVNGKKASSASVKIKVSGQASSNAGNSNMRQEPGAQIHQAGARISGNDLFIKVSANKSRVHEQEPILLTYKVYTQVELTQLEGKMPDLKGFHTQEIPQPAQKSFHIETIDGRPYRCVTWSQYVMYPQMTGELEIPSITYKGIVVQENRNVDPFEAFFNGGSAYIEVKKSIVAPALTIQVDPLPTRPAGFSGGVGNFTISSSIDKETVAANEPVTLRVVINGTGNLKLIKQPVVDFPKDFDKYDPKTTDKTRLTANGVEGNVIYDFLFVPRNQGDYTIPPIELTYYDTKQNTYKTVKTLSQTIHVTPGEKSTTSVSDFKEKEQDIRGLMLGNDKTTSRNIFFATQTYKATITIIIIIFVVLIWIFRKRAIANADIVGKRGKKANKVATKRLKNAAKLMKQQKHEAFYDEVLRALWGYVGDKLNIPVSKLSRENITERLTERNVDSDIINTFVDAIDECEFARYAPGETRGKMTSVYDKAMKGITNIDDFLKGKRRTADSNSERNNNKKTHNGMNISRMLLILMALTLSHPHAYAELTKESADEAYSKGNYQKAIKTYEQLLKKTPSAELYYNLGNAYYRTDNIPKAIIAYEKAQRLMPGNADIAHNLSVARTKTIDKMQPQQETIIVAGWHAFVNMFNTNTWATISVISLLLVVLLTLTYLFSDMVMLRKAGFYGAIALFLIFIISNVCAYNQLKRLESKAEAIIVRSACNVKKSPEPKAADAAIIHEGTHITIIDETIKGWYEVILDDGTEGWITDDAAERIIIPNNISR